MKITYTMCPGCKGTVFLIRVEQEELDGSRVIVTECPVCKWAQTLFKYEPGRTKTFSEAPRR